MTRFTYRLSKDKPPIKVVEQDVEDTSPLARAVEAEAEKHPPGTIVCGVSQNDEIKHVGPLE